MFTAEILWLIFVIRYDPNFARNGIQPIFFSNKLCNLSRHAVSD